MIIPATDINLLGEYSKLQSIDSFILSMRMMLTFIVLFEGYLRIVPFLLIKHFRFYYAKVFVKSSLDERRDEVKRTKHLFVGLNSYRKYLRSHLDLDIESSKVYPRIIGYVFKERNELINLMYKAFSEDSDKLKPIIYLRRFMKVPAEELLIKESNKDKLKQLTILFIPIITVVINVVTLLFK